MKEGIEPLAQPDFFKGGGRQHGLYRPPAQVPAARGEKKVATPTPQDPQGVRGLRQMRRELPLSTPSASKRESGHRL